MQLSKKQIGQLIKIMETTQELLTEASRALSSSEGDGSLNKRRRGKDLVAFKKMIKAERKGGTSVSELARKHGVTPSYIYQLR